MHPLSTLTTDSFPSNNVPYVFKMAGGVRILRYALPTVFVSSHSVHSPSIYMPDCPRATLYHVRGNTRLY